MAKSKGPKMSTSGVRLTADIDSRLSACAERVKTSKHHLMVLGTEAVVEAIEEEKGEVVLPIKFDVRKVPVLRKTEGKR